MSIIKQGFNDKPLHIRFDTGSGGDRVAGLWVEQEGLEDESNPARHAETLSYATLDELLDLKDEITQVIQELIK